MTYHHFCTDTCNTRWQIPEMDNPTFRNNLSYMQADKTREAYRLLAELALEDGLELVFVPSATNQTMEVSITASNDRKLRQRSAPRSEHGWRSCAVGSRRNGAVLYY